MIVPIRLATLPMGDLRHAIAHPDPDLWAALTPADLKEIRRRCTQHWTVWWMQLHPLRLFALVTAALAVPAVVFLVVAAKVDLSDLSAWRNFFALVGVVAAILTGLLMLLMTICFVVFKLDRLSDLADRLKTVPHAEYYSKFSLDTLAHSDSAQAYYDQVKAQGRDLCVVDFDVLLKLTAADRLNSPT